MRELIHDFYIIESLKENDIQDGLIFRDSLDSIKKLPIYEYVKNFKQLEKALENFEKSNYKYLLISCHGDEENLELNKEKINQITLHYYSFVRDKKQMKEYIYLPGEKRNRKNYPI